MKIIAVDDERALLENFRLTVAEIPGIESLELFQSSEEALAWVEGHEVDVAFLDIEMPVIPGIELGKRIHEVNPDVKIVYVTAYAQYAMEAFGVDAIGYLLKPYEAEDIQHELEKAGRIKPRAKKKISIYTMPDLLITVDGNPISMRHTKVEELLALLVDRGSVGVTSGEVLACLWEGDVQDKNKYWITFSRLKDKLEEEGIAHILGSNGQTKFLRTDLVDCDLYRMLAGDKNEISRYAGNYLTRYSWAEDRNAQLTELKATQFPTEL